MEIRMTDQDNNIADEIKDLKKELEHFQQEKERIRAIVGKIGGIPKFNTKAANYIFMAIIIITLIISTLYGGDTRLLMIEFATVALAVKILYMMHCQSKVNHFQLWMQSSIEWRINEITKILKQIQKKQNKQE